MCLISKTQLSSIFKEIALYHKENKAVIVIDEFQNIFFVEEDEGVMRNFFQELPADLPNSSDFLAKVKMSSGGLRPLLKRLENDAVIYSTEDAYVLSDPIMGYFLRTYRT